MDKASLANLEALLNIFVNGTTILRADGMYLLLGALSVLFLKKWSVARKLAIVGLAACLLTLPASGMINWLVVSLGESPLRVPILWTTGIVGTLLVLALFALWVSLPTVIAFRRKKRNRKFILVLNILLGLIPLGWNVVLFMSLIDDRQESISSP